MTEDYLNRFGGIARLYGDQALAKFHGAHVAVVGIGGVGSWTVESLARSGVGSLTLIDLDEICLTNINRQLHAQQGKIGQLKIEAMAERVRAINPDISLTLLPRFFSKASEDAFFATDYDVVVDAIDSGMQKARLVAGCRQRNVPIITCGAAGGKTDPTKIITGDLARTRGDSLLNHLRRTLRNRYNFPKNPNPKERPKKFRVTAIYSEEPVRYYQCDGTMGLNKPDAETSGRLTCSGGLGSSSPLTGAFGLVAAATALQLLSN